ncbi:DUF58 domain-containing protein, partial [Mycobacterium tuberculosis]
AVLALAVLAPRAVALPAVGAVVLPAAASGVVRAFRLAPALRAAFARAAAAPRAAVARPLRGCGAPLLSLRPAR